MKLTQKDKAFLECLSQLVEEGTLWIELTEDGEKRLVLRQNYGEKVESAFGLSRQGVRWRFQRIFNDIYTNAYLTILSIEADFGAALRSQAMAIARQRCELRQKASQLTNSELSSSTHRVVSGR